MFNSRKRHKVHIPPVLHHLTGGKKMVEVEGNDLYDCMDELVKLHPSLHGWIFDKAGEIGNSLTVLVNNKNIQSLESMRLLSPTDEIRLILVVGGG